MVIIQLSGGLGNQLFQYAYGKARAIEMGVDLKLDLSFYENYDWHEYSLAPFNIKANIASVNEIEEIIKLDQKITNKVLTKIFKRPNHFIQEGNLLFDPRYLRIRRNSFVKGYWQSEKYFSANKKLILDEFEIKVSPSYLNQRVISDISRENSSVSLHIRRGNYVNIESVNKVHGVVSLDYYYKAIKIIEAKILDPKFFVFSDDIDWVKSNFKIDNRVSYIDINDDKHDYEDLRLMSLCKHNIIANSTFSWWGAYLNRYIGKIVIAPDRWFVEDTKNVESRDIVPSNWIRLS
jgi:hypothetical protein